MLYMQILLGLPESSGGSLFTCLKKTVELFFLTISSAFFRKNEFVNNLIHSVHGT